MNNDLPLFFKPADENRMKNDSIKGMEASFVNIMHHGYAPRKARSGSQS